MRYDKPPLTFPQQVRLLIDRGLTIPDIKLAQHVLEHINYYRLSAYCIPFQTVKDVFDEETTIDDILYLYEFDRRLRNLLFEGLARIEVSSKTQIAHYLAMNYGAFCYRDSKYFSFMRHVTHIEWFNKVKDTIKHSHETFKKHFFAKYDQETELPIWMVIELMSFGQVSQLYKGMKKQDKQDIARGYFKIDQRLMSSWLHTIVYMRNLCAHHSRVWNRKLAVRPLINKKDLDWNDIDNSHIFGIFLLIKKMMHFQDKWDEWSRKLLTLLGEFSEVQVEPMGFPENWRKILFEK